MGGREYEAVGDERAAANVFPISALTEKPPDGGHPGKGANGAALAVDLATRNDPLHRAVQFNVSTAPLVLI